MKKKLPLNNLEEYNDPILYDFENNDYEEDIKFISKWAAKTEGTIIDLACGTGRATISLAKAGHNLIGVDLHSGMLREAKKKASLQNLRIEWVEQDCTNLNLNVKGKLIFSVGNSFQHFITNEDQDEFLSSVHRHLTDDGVFIFGTRFPSIDELFQPSTEEYWKSYTDKVTNQKVDVSTISSYDPMYQIQHYTTIRKFRNTAGWIVDEIRTNISLRYVFPKEMERLLNSNGLEILNVYGDWNENTLTAESSQMVYVCKKRKKIMGVK